MNPMKTIRSRSLAALGLAGALTVVASCKPSASAPPPKPAIETLETSAVENAIRQYRNQPSEQSARAVDLALAKMESEVRELEVRSGKVSGDDKAENDRKLRDLRMKYEAFRAEFTAAKAAAGAQKAGDSVEKAGDAAGRAVEKAGDAIKDAADSVGDALKN